MDRRVVSDASYTIEDYVLCAIECGKEGRILKPPLRANNCIAVDIVGDERST